MTFLTVENESQMLVRTNFWTSDMARQGYVYLTWNAGAARLLVPKALEGDLADMNAASEILISAGEVAGTKVLQVEFDDGSDAPYCLIIDAQRSSDRQITKATIGEKFPLLVYTEKGLQFEKSCVQVDSANFQFN